MENTETVKINSTPKYYIDAIKRYQEKNKEKIKQYQKQYRFEKACKVDLNSIPNEKLTKTQLLIKINNLEKEIELLKNNKTSTE